MDTENKTTLVVMAAGMGSRFGGLKQIEPVGPDGQIILDYSVYDALKAGFNKTVFVIKKQIEKDFREVIGKRAEKLMDVSYAFQEIDKVPSWFNIPSERTKPWGTGHAVLCTRDLVDTPFAVINADDYYGKDSFIKLHNHLIQPNKDFCMVGFHLENTLTENGSVARGVCEIDESGNLKSITERTKIVDCKFTEDDINWTPLAPETLVSMNMWGFPVSVFDELNNGFENFLKTDGEREKSEYYLPSMVDKMIKENRVNVKVLPTKAKWFGVTYKADKPVVMNAMKDFTNKGMYIGL